MSNHFYTCIAFPTPPANLEGGRRPQIMCKWVRRGFQELGCGPLAAKDSGISATQARIVEMASATKATQEQIHKEKVLDLKYVCERVQDCKRQGQGVVAPDLWRVALQRV